MTSRNLVKLCGFIEQQMDNQLAAGWQQMQHQKHCRAVSHLIATLFFWPAVSNKVTLSPKNISNWSIDVRVGTIV